MQGLQAEPGLADCLILYFFLYMQDLQAEPGLGDLLILYFFLYMQDLQAGPGLAEQTDLQAVVPGQLLWF